MLLNVKLLFVLKISFIASICIVLVGISILFFQQSDAIIRPHPAPGPSFAYLCDPTTFVSIRYPAGWYNGSVTDDNGFASHLFFPRNDIDMVHVRFWIKSALFGENETPKIIGAMEPDLPGNSIPEQDGFTYYLGDDNLIKGRVIFKNYAITNSSILNKGFNSAWIYLGFEADDPSIYNKYLVSQEKGQSFSFKFNDGRPCNWNKEHAPIPYNVTSP